MNITSGPQIINTSPNRWKFAAAGYAAPGDPRLLIVAWYNEGYSCNEFGGCGVNVLSLVRELA